MSRLRPDPSRCFLALCAAALLGLPVPATAQQVVISGVVVDSVARSPIAGALVALGGGPRVLTDADGGFGFLIQRPGTFQLRVEAVGYVSYSETITVATDTTLTIGLGLRPFAVDTLQVTSRLINVKGWITDLENGRPIMDASLSATGNRDGRTRRTGYFEFSRVRTQLPFDLRILAFGYEPVYMSVIPQADTTLNLQLRADTMIARLVADQVVRLEQRAVGVIGKSYAIDREALLSQPDGMSLAEVFGEIMKRAPYSMANGTTCHVVDERPVAADYYLNLFPEEVHRIEVFTDGRMNMIRVYTRWFMSSMITSDEPLQRPGFRQSPRGFMGAETPLATSCY